MAALLLTIGTARVAGEDSTHFNRPTDVAVLPNGAFYVSDGYTNTRFVKFSSMGKFEFLSIPLGLIVNELVTNSLKHAFPDDQEGNIEVILTRNSVFALVARDNGIGCPNVKSGTGSRLTRLLAQQLGARIEWQSREVGCEVRLEFVYSNKGVTDAANG